MSEQSANGKPTKMTRFEEALVYAARLHATQVRKGSQIPYVSHLLGVASIVMEYGGNEDEAIAALLHDAIEDQGGDATRQEIRCRFGERIAAIVEGCTDADTVPKPPWKQRKSNYIAHLPKASPSVLLVSAADKLSNARAILADYRTLGEELWKRFTGRKDGTLWYYRELVKVYRATKTPVQLADELDRVVTEIERLSGASAG